MVEDMEPVAGAETFDMEPSAATEGIEELTSGSFFGTCSCRDHT